MLVRRKPTASTAVVRVSRLAVPRLDMNPAPPPMPKPPPSDFCSNTVAISVATIIRWITITTVCISTFRRKPKLSGFAGFGFAGFEFGPGVTRLHRALSPPIPLHAQLGTIGCNRKEIGGLEARPADQGAVDVGDP